jgi:putative thioredoxin
MEAIIGGGAAVAGDANLVKNGSTATFMADVIDASHDAAVVVDFWAPWCGPCKQLGPALEKAVRDAKGAVRMVKINIDENPELAQQMRIQSIPAVYAFKDGRPVDGFVGALPDSQVKQFVGKLAAAAGGGASPVAEAVALAKEAFAAGDLPRAANIFAQVAQHDPDNVDAMAGLARIAIAKKDLKQARAILEKIPSEHAGHAEVTAARAGLELAEAGAQAAGAVGELRARLERNAADHQARLDLASALFAAGAREEAVDQLLELVRRDRAWNEQAARKQLVKFFEAIGLGDPLTVQSRKRLSSILFS